MGEYDELIRGLHGPLHSALTRMKQVLDEDRMARDMSSFKGRSLTKDDFWYQTKVVLGVTLSKAELDAVFDYFDEDGGGSIDYGEILNKFARREHLDLTMTGRSKRRTYRSGIEFRKVNIDRVHRRRKREIERKRIREERRKMRSARIRKALREQFEDRLENRIALGVREPRTSISKRQSNLIELHESQVKGKRVNTRSMFEKSMKDVQMSRVKARPPTPPKRPQQYFNAESLLMDWIFTLKTVFGIYVKYQLSFTRTKRYDFDDLTKTKGTIDETNWLRCLTDFNIVPNLISEYDAKGIFHKSNLTLSPNKADTSIVAQDRPIGMKGPEQWRLCNFEDFISAIVGIAHSRASFFAYHSTSQGKCDALMSYMRDKSVQCNQTKEILKYYNKKKVVSGSVDIDNFLSHGNDAPSYIWRLRRVFGDERAENTQWNAWLHLTTPTFYYEWRLSENLRTNLGESRWVAVEILDEIPNNAVNNLHILQSVKVDTYHKEERKIVLEEILPKLYNKYNVFSPTEVEESIFKAKARKLYAKRTNRPYRLYKDRKPAEAIPTVPTVDGRAWIPASKRYKDVKVPKHVERLHVDVKHDLLKEMSNEKLKKLDTIERTKAMRSHNSGIGFGTASYMDNRAPMSEEAMKKWNSHATLRKKYFNRDARVDRLAFLGEKSRSEMTMGRQVTARWATEIIVRIADECTTGEAKQRIEEKCDFDDTKEIRYKKWLPKYTLSRKKGEHLVGLPQYPKGHPMATLKPPTVPNLRPKETEKAVDRKLREDVINKKKALLRERRRRRRQQELAEKLEDAKREKKMQEVARIAEEAKKNAAAKARKIAEQEAKKQTQEATRLEIEAWKIKREQRKQVEMRNREYVEDVSGRYYSMRVLNARKHVETIEEKAYKARRVSPMKKFFKADDTTDFDIEELNRRRREAKEKRLRAVKAMEKAKAREKAEFDALEEKLRLANNPLDKVSLKLTMAIKKNQAKLADIFRKIDTDGSGNVTYKEFRRGLFKVGIKLNTKEVHELCKGLDKDGDGVVSYLELKRFMDTSINNTHAGAASIQARWRAKRINMKTKAELKEEYRQKQLKEQTMRLTKKSADWQRELQTDLVVDQDEYDDHGRKIKKSKRKQSVYRQKSPKRSPKSSLSDSQRSSSSFNDSTKSVQSSTMNTTDSKPDITDSKPDIVKWDSTGNENSSPIESNTITNWNADNES